MLYNNKNILMVFDNWVLIYSIFGVAHANLEQPEGIDSLEVEALWEHSVQVSSHFLLTTVELITPWMIAADLESAWGNGSGTSSFIHSFIHSYVMTLFA